MKCIKCNQELNDNAMFCVHCGKTTNKIANYLRTTGIIHLVLSGIGLITGLVNLSESIDMIGKPLTIWGVIFGMFVVYVAIMIIMYSHSYEKTSLLKKLSITYLIVAIVAGLINEIVMFLLMENIIGMVGLVAGTFSLVGTCVMPILYIIFTSKLEKRYLQKSFDDNKKEKDEFSTKL